MNCGKNMSTNRRIFGQNRGIQARIGNNTCNISVLSSKFQ